MAATTTTTIVSTTAAIPQTAAMIAILSKELPVTGAPITMITITVVIGTDTMVTTTTATMAATTTTTMVSTTAAVTPPILSLELPVTIAPVTMITTMVIIITDTTETTTTTTTAPTMTTTMESTTQAQADGITMTTIMVTTIMVIMVITTTATMETTMTTTMEHTMMPTTDLTQEIQGHGPAVSLHHHLPRLQAQILKLTWEMAGVYKTGLIALTRTVQAMEMDNKSTMNSMRETWKMLTCAPRERAANANVKASLFTEENSITEKGLTLEIWSQEGIVHTRQCKSGITSDAMTTTWVQLNQTS